MLFVVLGALAGCGSCEEPVRCSQTDFCPEATRCEDDVFVPVAQPLPIDLTVDPTLDADGTDTGEDDDGAALIDAGPATDPTSPTVPTDLGAAADAAAARRDIAHQLFAGPHESHRATL